MRKRKPSLFLAGTLYGRSSIDEQGQSHTKQSACAGHRRHAVDRIDQRRSVRSGRPPPKRKGSMPMISCVRCRRPRRRHRVPSRIGPAHRLPWRLRRRYGNSRRPSLPRPWQAPSRGAAPPCACRPAPLPPPLSSAQPAARRPGAAPGRAADAGKGPAAVHRSARRKVPSRFSRKSRPARVAMRASRQ